MRAADSVFAHSRSGMEMAGEVGRPGLSPGIYFRLLMVGYVEGIDSDSHIFPQSVQAWLTVRRNRSRAHVELLTSLPTPSTSSPRWQISIPNIIIVLPSHSTSKRPLPST